MEHGKFTELRAFFQFHLEFIDVAIQFSFFAIVKQNIFITYINCIEQMSHHRHHYYHHSY